MTDTIAALTGAASAGVPAAASPAPDAGFLAVGAFALTWDDDRPLSLHSPHADLGGRPGVALVEVFTADEQRARTSQAMFRSAVGERLRVHAVRSRSADGFESVEIVQRDDATGLEARTELTVLPMGRSVRIRTLLANTSAEPVVLTALGSATVGLGRTTDDLGRMVLSTADSEWLAENRWRSRPLTDELPALSLPLHGQDGRGHWSLSSHGSWSTGEHLPVGVIDDGRQAIAWQIESSAAWQVDLCQTAQGGALTLLGPADLEHHFAHRLLPGESFAAVPAVLAVATADRGSSVRDEAFAELTRHRRAFRAARSASEELPIVYNDFMNTLMGQPSTEALLPLIARAAEVGAEVFCIDAGWFAAPELGDWWATVGEWREAEGRFPDGGLARLTTAIRDAGMRVGLWLEPEVVGVRSAAALTLPEEAFFHRFGRRVQEHERLHLDFRHPAARAHLDAVVDLLVAEHGTSYLKLDYNINPGAGTEWRATAAGDGLLAHARAYRDWLQDVQRRHPGLLIENCSSGAMRADYGLLEVTHLQSTSDQQDFLRYAPIAASAPASILPEQCGNWAYPESTMSDEETAFTLVTGLSGRLYLSGFLDELREDQRRAVTEAVAWHKEHRELLRTAVPFWLRGLPGWEDPLICLGLRGEGGTLLFVWDRAEDATEFALPGMWIDAVFPHGGWEIRPGDRGTTVRTVPGATARVLVLRERNDEG